MTGGLIINQISKTYNHSMVNAVEALKDVTIKATAGEYLLLKGNNGSGKSTLLNIINGFIQQTAGNISFNDWSFEHLPPYKRAKWIYRLFQDREYGIISNANILENLAVSEITVSRQGIRFMKKLVSRERRSLYKTIVEKYNSHLATNMESRLYTLSPGERQAVILSMLDLQLRARSPGILLADEPDASLDPGMSEKCYSLLKKFAEKGWIVMVVTHNPEIINSHEGRLLEFEEGKLIKDILQTT